MLCEVLRVNDGVSCYLWLFVVFDLISDEILKVNDAVTKAMSLYMKRVQGVADENGEAGEARGKYYRWYGSCEDSKFGFFCFSGALNCSFNSLAAIVRICGHHSTKRTMPISAYADLDFENSCCPSDVLDAKLTNTDDSLGIPCLLFIGLSCVCSMTCSLADDKKVYR